MHLNQDFRDLLFALNDAGGDYLVVGAHALAALVMSARRRISTYG